MKMNINLKQYPKMINTSEKKIVEKIKTHILCSVTLFPESRVFNWNVETYGRARQAQMAI
jgi:hypothetical protein